MTTLKIRPSISGADSHALTFAKRGATSAMLFADIADLVKLNDATGQLDDDTLVCDLQKFFEAPNVDRARDLRLWKDTSGKLIGFGQLLMPEQNDEIEGYLYFDVHPTRRGDGLETEILRWSEERLREVGKERDLPIKLRTYTNDDKIVRRMLLEKQGFTTERCFLTMACSLEQPLSSSSLPSGFTLQRLSGDGRYRVPLCALRSAYAVAPFHAAAQRSGDLKAWVELFNESFIDHWDHHELTVTRARHWLKNPNYKPELNLIAVAPDGTFAAFCVGYINEEENARSGRNEGWIKLLGTRRGFRKLGLGRAMLLAAMRQFKAAGVEQVKLGVDAQSLTSATRLYESVGFHPVNTWLSYVKEIQP
jgi:GNAT superfamily N-acetyltransferase